jgi:hypothetical protein
VLLLALFTSASGASETVYRTVEEGVPSFSDTPPADGRSVQAITIEVAPSAGDELLDQRLAAMRETTERMAQDRRERELHRAKLRAEQQAQEQPAAQAPAQTVVVQSGAYWPVYTRPYRPRPPYRPAPPLRPGPPAMRPPVPTPYPGWSVMRPGNAQLMRPIVSRRDPPH